MKNNYLVGLFIECKYLPPSNKTGSRIKMTLPSGKKKIIPFDHSFPNTHEIAAAFAEKHVRVIGLINGYKSTGYLVKFPINEKESQRVDKFIKLFT